MTKIAVYAIACNEEKNVDEWYDSAWDADYITVFDTGSTDGTKDALRSHAGINVGVITINPWRFDDARNAVLASIPDDVDMCINLDLDERLQPGWYEALVKAHESGITRPLYRYVWNWQPDGKPGFVYHRDHAHARHGYRWKNPVHETLVPSGIGEVREVIDGLEVHHHADDDKPRYYLPLLIQSVVEDPDNDRNVHYLAREYMNVGLYEEAVIWFKRHLELPSAIWDAERSTSMRFIARSIQAVDGDTAEVEQWLLRACGEAPGYREPWLALARHYHTTGQEAAAIGAAHRGLSITERRLDYLSEPDAWNGALEAIVEGRD